MSFENFFQATGKQDINYDTQILNSDVNILKFVNYETQRSIKNLFNNLK